MGPASGILLAIVRKIFADLDDWIIVIFDNFLILADSYKDATAKVTTVLQRCPRSQNEEVLDWYQCCHVLRL